jgi:hypothetical protein
VQARREHGVDGAGEVELEGRLGGLGGEQLQRSEKRAAQVGETGGLGAHLLVAAAAAEREAAAARRLLLLARGHLAGGVAQVAEQLLAHLVRGRGRVRVRARIGLGLGLG